MTNYGKKLLTGRWTGHELDMMQQAWHAGVSLPYPIGARGDGLLMQFLGDAVELVGIHRSRQQGRGNLHIVVAERFDIEPTLA